MPSNTDTLDDIFGSSPEPETSTLPTTHRTSEPNQPEPSDLPSLRRQHVTTGYREGISTSKGTHVQEGFDAGFPVGAQLGMRAGTVLGVLEGLVRGFEGGSKGVVRKQPLRRAGDRIKDRDGEGERGGEGDDGEDVRRREKEKRERILQVYRDAIKELDVRGVFSGLDGDAIVASQREEGGMKPQGQLQRKGEEVISRWEGRVSVSRWEENMEALEVRDGGGDGVGLEGRVKESS